MHVTTTLGVVFALLGNVGDPGGSDGNESTRPFLAMGEAELRCAFQRAVAAPLPQGRLRGTPLPRPGSPWNGAAARVGRLVWQGKVIEDDSGRVVNRFFGLRGVPGELRWDASWIDGSPTLVIDYQETSWIYAPFRDEIRQVAPGLYLGIMLDRRQPDLPATMYFLLEVR